MEFKGTKGKWEVYIGWNQDGVASTESGVSICRISRHLTEEEKANALLISKAPEMLEMLNVVLQELEAPDSMSSNLPDKIKELIQSATELKERKE